MEETEWEETSITSFTAFCPQDLQLGHPDLDLLAIFSPAVSRPYMKEEGFVNPLTVNMPQHQYVPAPQIHVKETYMRRSSDQISDDEEEEVPVQVAAPVPQEPVVLNPDPSKSFTLIMISLSDTSTTLNELGSVVLVDTAVPAVSTYILWEK